MIELVLRLGLSLGIVLGLFWAIARTGSKRMGGSRSLMKVRSRQSLSRSSSVAVVEVGSRVLVVGVSDGGVALLTELDPAEVAETAPAAQAVASTAPGRRAARTPLAARPLRLRPAMRSTGGCSACAAAPDSSPLAGSVLAPGTWKSAWAALSSRSARPVASQGRS